jgi:hypothetical protein
MHDFSEERRGVLLGMATAFAVMIGAASATWFFADTIPLDASLEGRLKLGAIAALLPPLVLAVQIGRMASRRFNSPESIMGAAYDGPTSPLSLDKALLSNSVEQSVLAIPTYMFLSLMLPAELLVVVPTIAVLFVIGRSLFVARYTSGAAARSLGFGLTFYPTIAGMLGGATILLS